MLLWIEISLFTPHLSCTCSLLLILVDHPLLDSLEMYVANHTIISLINLIVNSGFSLINKHARVYSPTRGTSVFT